MPDDSDRAGMLDVLDQMRDSGAITAERHQEMTGELLAQWARSGVPVVTPRKTVIRQIEGLDRARGYLLNSEGAVYQRILRLLRGKPSEPPDPPVVVDFEPMTGTAYARRNAGDTRAQLSQAEARDIRGVRLIRTDGVYVPATAEPYTVLARAKMTTPLWRDVFVVELGSGEAYLLVDEAEYSA